MKIINEYKNWLQEAKDTKLISDKLALIIVLFVIICCALIRVLTFSTLPLEITFWKEIDYLNISRGFWEHGFNIFKPEVLWLADPPRITAMEFPLIPYVSSLLYFLFGYNIFTVRIMTLLAFIGLIFYLFKFVQRELGNLIAILAALAASIMPLYHPFSQILFSDPWVIAFSVFTIYHFAEWLENDKKSNAIQALIGFTLTIALKITALYILIPLVWILYRKYQFKVKNYFKYIGLGLLGLILPIAWYMYAYYLTNNSVDVFGVFGGHNKFQTFTMLMDPLWYKTMFFRLSRDILGGEIGLFLCIIGFIATFLVKKNELFISYLVAILAFFVIVAEGQLDAPYRQMTIIPVFSVFVALGTISVLSIISFLVNKFKKSNYQLNPHLQLAFASILIIGMLLSNYHFVFSNKKVRDLQGYQLAQAIKDFKMVDTKIITAGEYTIHAGGNDLSPNLYYYADVQGWSLQAGDWNMKFVDSLIIRGATMFTANNMSREPESLDFIKLMEEKYPVLYMDEEKEMLILDLTRIETFN